MVTYADARRDYEESWQGEFDRSASIWEETDLNVAILNSIDYSGFLKYCSKE
ncbi:hypothetical protein [Lysinibacillus agricola]|uniref:hypothetical protein n=1 Tax=Lysinibacillus agricola TaxID=2590012 RepID=UPI000A58F4F3